MEHLKAQGTAQVSVTPTAQDWVWALALMTPVWGELFEACSSQSIGEAGPLSAYTQGKTQCSAVQSDKFHLYRIDRGGT